MPKAAEEWPQWPQAISWGQNPISKVCRGLASEPISSYGVAASQIMWWVQTHARAKPLPTFHLLQAFPFPR